MREFKQKTNNSAEKYKDLPSYIRKAHLSIVLHNIKFTVEKINTYFSFLKTYGVMDEIMKEVRTQNAERKRTTKLNNLKVFLRSA